MLVNSRSVAVWYGGIPLREGHPRYETIRDRVAREYEKKRQHGGGVFFVGEVKVEWRLKSPHYD